jgi:MscS family membrane protein
MSTNSPRCINPHPSTLLRSGIGNTSRRWRAAACWFIIAYLAVGQENVHPLKPLDRSSPRATMRTFLESGDALGEFLAKEYIPSPSRAKFHQLIALADNVVSCLDLSEVPPAARLKTGRAAALALYETLSRIHFPPLDDIPDTEPWSQASGTNFAFWMIPNTDIVLVRAGGRSPRGDCLFSADTVAQAELYYKRVRGLPYTRPVPLENMREMIAIGGGWMIPHSWIQGMPAWLRSPLAGQAVWKWVALLAMLAVCAPLLRSAFRLSKRGSSEHPFLYALAQLVLPAFFVVMTTVLAYFALAQLSLSGVIGSAIELAATAIMFLAAAWISWRVAPVIAEAIIASPKIAPESIDANLIRICTRLLGMSVGLGLLVIGADRLGLPLYGIIAGLGVGGLAIALAAQPTIENLIGGLSLLTDKPIRVGDFCRYGTDTGRVEAIGIRSTRIRGLDQTLTTIPNAALSRMPVVNVSMRDQIQLKTNIGMRYETTPQQLRSLLVRIRDMLLAHPYVLPNPLRVRFVGFGASSLDLEVSAHIDTQDWDEFLGIQEAIYLRIMDLVEESGTAIAFPSRTLYLARDKTRPARPAEGSKSAGRERQCPDSSPDPTPWKPT